MAGSIQGGKLAAVTNKSKYGNNFYRIIGAKGGRASNTGGFAYKDGCDDPNCEFLEKQSPHLVRQCAGAKGGKISRRGKDT